MVSVSPIKTVFANSPAVKAPNFLKRLYNAIPSREVVSDKFISHVEKFGKKCTSAHQRGILGATALLTQPFIDAHNKSVDEKTRKYSVARTIAKIIAGSLTGVAIRYGCIKAMSWKPFLPQKWKSPEITDDMREQYKNAMGTIVSLVVMLFTNFIIDAPLTKYLTNVLTGNTKKKGDKNEIS